MEKNLQQIFKNLKTPEPSQELAGSIMFKIEKLRGKQVKRRLIWSRVSLFGSFGAFALSVWICGATFLQSDFWVLLRLTFTDAGAVLKNWNDFFFSLAETFPVVSAAIMLIPVVAILFSLSVYFKISRSNYNLHLT